MKAAKLARYTAPPQTIFEVAKQVAEQHYKLYDVDADHARFMTVGQAYEKGGGKLGPAISVTQVQSRMYIVGLVVEVLPTDRGQAVVVTPKTFEVLTGSPKPRELKPDDPGLPGWVHGKADALAIDIYRAAKQHAVQ